MSERWIGGTNGADVERLAKRCENFAEVELARSLTDRDEIDYEGNADAMRSIAFVLRTLWARVQDDSTERLMIGKHEMIQMIARAAGVPDVGAAHEMTSAIVAKLTGGQVKTPHWPARP